MCGIAGVVDWAEAPRLAMNSLIAMQNTLTRRGPDQRGIYADDCAALVHARLCVVDIERGRQPMSLALGDERLHLIYNGELYNTSELRDELAVARHRFNGHSDTEVVLHAYAEWGAECVSRFNGIFAFAVWEQRERRLFLARDRIGVKPLFYSQRPKGLLFGSEIKALLAHPSMDARLDSQGVAELMLIGPGRTPGCGVLMGIEELPPAHCGYYDQNGLNTWAYWRLTDRTHEDSFEDTVEQVRYLVQDSIERQLVSDVKLGTLLSGGLDSSIISAVADQHFQRRGEQLHTFSVFYEDNERYFKSGKFQPSSDDDFIRQMNESLGAQHHRIVLKTDELLDALYDAVEARDLPGMADVDASLLLFCREIKQHVTVALSGECADEIFGGYPWYRDPEIRARYGFPWSQSTDYRATFLAGDYASEIDAKEYVDQRYRAALLAADVREGADDEERRMKQMVSLNLNWFMQTLLDRKDRMSMYSGLEVRVPFCDYRIAEYLYSVPWAYKDHQGTEKGLLRMAVKDLLPESVLWRKKSPYPKTHNPAYLEAVSVRLRDVMRDGDSPLLQIVSKQALDELLVDDRSVPWYGQLMTTPQTIAYMLQLDHWLRTYKVILA
ncbi:asparagine synthase (glutamine-hydrolyzing) [Eubacteriales bacterium OttesenSCG-928-N13]|nr:asparagine synthase (glutamine-hydrolyzing) [Eubacteriales bacterium OttesenSCG-928-N13]